MSAKYILSLEEVTRDIQSKLDAIKLRGHPLNEVVRTKDLDDWLEAIDEWIYRGSYRTPSTDVQD